MKSGIIILFSSLLLLLTNYLFAQEEQLGGRFNFEKYDPVSDLQYEEIDPSEIKSVYLSYQKIPNSGINQYLFYPAERSGNFISLDSLMIWAAYQDHLVLYENMYFGDSDLRYFARTTDTISLERIALMRKPSEYYGDQDMEVSDPVVDEYIVLKSTVIGKDKKVLAVRPLLITPVQSYLRWGMDTIREVLYTAYFPDLLNLLQHHGPLDRIKGMKNTYEFFLKGKAHEIDNSNIFFRYEVFGEDLVYDDTIPGAVIEDGIYVDPGIGAYRGNPGSDKIEEEAPLQGIADLQGLSYAKYYKHTIALKQKENWPLYLPVSELLGLKNIQGVLFDGLTEGFFEGYDFDEERILTADEIKVRMAEVGSMMIMDEFGNEEELAYVEPLFVEKLFVHELLFFDEDDKIIHREAAELVPLTSHYDYTDIPRYSAVCRIPFRDEAFRVVLHNSLVFNQTGAEYESFLSFFSQRKYKAESTRIQAISLEMAIEMIGSSYLDEREHKSPFSPIRVSNDKDTEIVIREIVLANDEDEQEESDLGVYETLDNYLYNNQGSLQIEDMSIPVNYQLFFPQYEYNGFKPFFDLMKHGLDMEQLRAYRYTDEEFLGAELSLVELNKILVYRDSIFDWGFDEFMEIEEEAPAAAIEKYHLMELHDGKRIIPLAIAPDIAGVSAYFTSEMTLGSEYPFWVPFSSQFRKIMLEQETLRIKKEAVSNYHDLIFGRQYVGKIIEKKNIDQEELLVLLSFINN